MNSLDRQSLANTFAVLLFLLLAYAMAGDMDCTSEQQMEQARQPASSQRKCEMSADNAATFDLEPSRQDSDSEPRCAASES